MHWSIPWCWRILWHTLKYTTVYIQLRIHVDIVVVYRDTYLPWAFLLYFEMRWSIPSGTHMYIYIYIYIYTYMYWYTLAIHWCIPRPFDTKSEMPWHIHFDVYSYTYIEMCLTYNDTYYTHVLYRLKCLEIHLELYMWIYTSVCVCMYVCTYVCMYVCMCV